MKCEKCKNGDPSPIKGRHDVVEGYFCGECGHLEREACCNHSCGRTCC